MSDETGLLTIDDLAGKLGLKRRAIQTMMAARKIPVIRINRRVVRFDFGAVQAALRKLTVREV
jgi:excisionase family DNA binding protein